jgi:hypothetical protein
MSTGYSLGPVALAAEFDYVNLQVSFYRTIRIQRSINLLPPPVLHVARPCPRSAANPSSTSGAAALCHHRLPWSRHLSHTIQDRENLTLPKTRMKSIAF